MNKVLFLKEENILTISIGKTKESFNLEKIVINHDDLAKFLTELSSYFVAEDFSYEVSPAEAVKDDKVKLFIQLIEQFVKTFKEEFTNLKGHYQQQIKNLKTKINE